MNDKEQMNIVDMLEKFRKLEEERANFYKQYYDIREKLRNNIDEKDKLMEYIKNNFSGLYHAIANDYNSRLW